MPQVSEISNTPHTKKNRKSFLINKPFQISILSWFAALTAILILIFYSSIWYFFYNFKNQAIAAGLQPSHILFNYMNEQNEALNSIFLISSLIAVVVIFTGGLILSHRVAGPIYRLTMYLKTKSKSDDIPLSFRKGDYFPELQDAFNEFLKK